MNRIFASACICFLSLAAGCDRHSNVSGQQAYDLYASIKEGRVDYLKASLEGGVSPDNFSKSYGFLIGWAAINRNLEAVDLLIKSGADVNAETSEISSTLIRVLNGNCPIAKLLLEHGANPGSKFRDARKMALGDEYQGLTARELYLLEKGRYPDSWKENEACWKEVEHYLFR